MSDGGGDQGQVHAAAIEDYLAELRTFPPPEGFARLANVSDQAIYAAAAADPEQFWADQARALTWFEPWEQVLDWQLPFAKWFVGGRLNVAFNCLDRHVEAGRGDKIAFYFEGEPGDRRTITYAQLLDEVGRCANALRSLGIERGDRVAIYMPMIPELPVAMLACARIGAAHSVVFGGFSADALARPHRGRQCPAPHHRRRRLEARPRRGAEGEHRPRPRERGPVDRERARRPPPRRHREEPRHARRARSLVARAGLGPEPAQPRRGDGRGGPALPALHLRYHGPPEGDHAHHRWLPDAGRVHAPDRLRPKARDRHLLVRGRHRVGHRPQLHRLRAARERGHERALRGNARFPGPGPLVVDHRAVRGHDAVHGADGHSHLHEVGDRLPRRPRPVQPAGARFGRRADQPRGVDLVLAPDRRRPLSDRRHVVADRDRRHHAVSAARRDDLEAGEHDLPVAGDRSRGRRRCRQDRRRVAAATSRSPGRGRPCCGAYTATRSGIARPTGAASRAATSQATGPRSTRTGTSGFWGASTMS